MYYNWEIYAITLMKPYSDKLKKSYGKPNHKVNVT